MGMYTINTGVKQMAQEKRLIVKMDPELHKAVKEKAEKEDLTMSQVVRHLLRKWLTEPPKFDQERES